jgi:hypothetical protein
MKLNSMLIALVLITLSRVSAMSEFDTLGQIISSGFYSGQPVSVKFISDWADSCSPELSHRICEQYNFPEDAMRVDEQEELVNGMCALLDEIIENPALITAFHSTIDKLESNKKRKIVPLLFNYMYRAN